MQEEDVSVLHTLNQSQCNVNKCLLEPDEESVVGQGDDTFCCLAQVCHIFTAEDRERDLAVGMLLINDQRLQWVQLTGVDVFHAAEGLSLPSTARLKPKGKQNTCQSFQGCVYLSG